MEVLGIEVSPALLQQWIEWFAPDRQPFYLTAKQIASWGLTQDDTEPNRQQRDTCPR
jgi:hypothetical protein